MVLLFSDGFDHYSSQADFQQIWVPGGNAFSSNTWNIAPAYARPPGGMGLIFFGGADANSYATHTLTTTAATFISGMNMNFSQGLASNPFVSFMDSGTTQVDLRMTSTGQFQITRNGTQLALSTNTVTQSTWYFVEMKATISPSAGAYELRVNGSSTGWIPSATSQNTRASSNSYINSIRLYRTLYQMDDFYLMDNTGSAGNDFTGGARIITIFANSTGNYSQWTGNYAANFANVNELSADGDAVFNMASTAGNKDTFGYDDVPSGTIHGIQQVMQARQDSGAARTIRALQRSGGTDYNGTTQSLAGSQTFVFDAKSINPATSAGYTTSDINNAEFGYELVT